MGAQHGQSVVASTQAEGDHSAPAMCESTGASAHLAMTTRGTRIWPAYSGRVHSAGCPLDDAYRIVQGQGNGGE